MSLPLSLAVFFTLWWTVLFATLPFGVRSQEEDGAIVPGSDPGAPRAPRLAIKAAWTTAITAVIFAGLYWWASISP